MDSGFICEQNKDWSDFLSLISQNTEKLNGDQWWDHARQNRKRDRKWAAEDLLDTGIGKTAVLIGAGPSLKKQVPLLRELGNDPRFILICVSSGLRYLLSNGIRPQYCMVMESKAVISKFFDGLEGTDDITLISGLCVPPSILDSWKGRVKFLALYTTIERLDKKIMKWYRPVNGCGIMFPAICSQYNTAAVVAYRVLGCRSLIFVGNELSFATKGTDSRYYVEGEDEKDLWERRPHPDIYGKTVYTSYNFMALKMSMEDYLQRLWVECVNQEGRVPYFINATEAGIFGVSKRYGNLTVSDPSGNKHLVLLQMTLEMAVRQTRNIMKYGKPITEESIVKRPSLEQIYAYA